MDKNLNLYDYCYMLRRPEFELCQQLDPLIAGNLESLDQLDQIWMYFSYGLIRELGALVETKSKFNYLLRESINDENVNFNRFKLYKEWLDEETLRELSNYWLKLEKVDPSTSWIIDYIPEDTDAALKALQRYTEIYKKKRSNQNVSVIESIFRGIPTDELEDACTVLSKATPAVSSLLLTRDDVPDKYVIKGLKALSKLSKQKEISQKIDFDMLGNLGPRARLDAMKQLVGLCDLYNKNKVTELPFKTIPKRDELELFLFPCSLKYNKEVKELVDKFEELTKSRR